MIPGVDRTVKCWRLEDNLMSANKLESDQSSPSAGITVGGDGDFKAIENFRPVEFTRDCNTVGITDFTDENLATAGLSLEQQQTYFFSYNIKTYQRGSIYNGIMHLFKTSIDVQKFILKAASL